MNNMKKFSILSLLLLLCTLNLHAEKSSADALKLHVKKAGTLHRLVEKKTQVSHHRVVIVWSVKQ